MSGRVPALVALDGRPLVSVSAAAPPPNSGSLTRAARPYASGDPFDEGMYGWAPPLLSADGEWANDRDVTVRRLRDLLRNDPLVAGAVGKYADHAVGSGLWPSLTPDHLSLGIDEEEARLWARKAVRMWRAYRLDFRRTIDVAMRDNDGDQQRIAFRDWLSTGAAFATVEYRPRGGLANTCFRMIDPDRLSNPMGRPDAVGLRRGVEIDPETNEAIAYHFRNEHPGSGALRALAWERVEARTDWGRPRVIHFMVPERSEQTIGRSPLVTMVKRLRMSDRYGSTELMAAVIASTLLAAVTSPFDHTAAQDMLQSNGPTLSDYQNNRTAYHRSRDTVFGHGIRMPMLYPGEEIKGIQLNRPQSGFQTFLDWTGRNLAAVTGGLTFENLVQDYSKTNYSSARAAMLDAWKSLSPARQMFAERFCRPRFVCWLEEVVLDGKLALPDGVDDFYAAAPYLTMGQWFGHGRGWVDPTKEAQGAKLRMEAGISTLEIEAAEAGHDWEDLLEAQARVRKRRRELGLPEQQTIATPPQPQQVPEPDTGDEKP